MIDQEQKASLIQSSIIFMRAVTDIYGADKGMELFNTIADTVDSNLKGEIFVALIKGEYDGKIRIKEFYPSSSRVDMIRTLRALDARELGLREAKELVDYLRDGNEITVHVRDINRIYAIKELTNAGFMI